MSSFTQALVCKQVGAREWEVTDGFDYEVGALGSGWVIHVPKGFRTDGASVPRFLWIVWPPFGGWWNQAATLHDLLYRTKFKDLERAVADVLLFDAMKALKVGFLSRVCIYLGVRAGGWRTYRKYRLDAAIAEARAARGYGAKVGIKF